MKKLTLSTDDLRVESFGTEPGSVDRGTVKAHSHYTCVWYECSPSGEYTCYNTGCQSGLSTVCESEGVTDCPGYDTCAAASADQFTCYNSCTNVEGCSFCGAMC